MGIEIGIQLGSINKVIFNMENTMESTTRHIRERNIHLVWL